MRGTAPPEQAAGSPETRRPHLGPADVGGGRREEGQVAGKQACPVLGRTGAARGQEQGRPRRGGCRRWPRLASGWSDSVPGGSRGS